MIEIRFHGRGGQGIVTAATILAEAIFLEGRWTQMIPHFGDERRGAPVCCFVRVDDKPIRLASEFMRPDCIIVADPMLPKVVDVEAGLKDGGVALFNDERPPEAIKTNVKLSKIASVDATSVAVETFGQTAITITGTVMLGAFSATTSWVKLDSLLASIRERFSGEVCQKNVAAAKLGYERTRVKNIVRRIS
ncbi:MAG: 2-oxoacid:acceptor oxidoreductase family protein [Candidatus Bathyarchaeia archaeon]